MKNNFKLSLLIFLGKAAKNINGVTVHAAFDFWGDDYVPLGDKKLAEVRNHFSELALILIDEMSMLSSDRLYMIEHRLCDVFQSEDTFANVATGLIGDEQQLPPVKAQHNFKEPKKSAYKPRFEVNNLWESFDVIDLKTNHRQGEGRWTDVLNKVRDGVQDEEVEEVLKSRCLSDDHYEMVDNGQKKSRLSRKKKATKPAKKIYKVSKEDFNSTHVFYTNKDMFEHNAKMLNLLETELHENEAVLALPKGYKPPLKHGHTIDETGYAMKLSVKVGAKVVLIANLNTPDGMVNGSLGSVVGIEKKDSKVDCIIVAFDDEETGAQQRQKYPGMSSKYAAQNGTPIYKHQHEWFTRGGKSRSAKAKALQFPLVLAFAITCHKIQGLTVKAGSKVVCHWHNSLPKSMAYVM